MIKLLIGGSPCTYWSISKTKGRETEPSGMGWELFKNYLIALDRYKPDYFLYENNNSMSKSIRAQIDKEFGFGATMINSALVSAQNRQRLYWVGKRKEDGRYSKVDVNQPGDRGILLRNILENGLYEPVNITSDGKSQCLRATYYKDGIRNMVGNDIDRKTCVAEHGDSSKRNVYEVKDGQITIKGKQYPIKLSDGHYIIRKLTVNECKRLQTVPDWYEFPVSNTRAYQLLGNGWTIDVISHIMSNYDGIATEPVEVLSMYDGMSCGRIALKNLVANVVRYYATEIDKYAIKTTQHNFQDTIQLGDAFQVRDADWRLP